MAQHRTLVRNWGSGFIAYVVAYELQEQVGLNREYVNPGVWVRQVDELFFLKKFVGECTLVNFGRGWLICGSSFFWAEFICIAVSCFHSSLGLASR